MTLLDRVIERGTFWGMVGIAAVSVVAGFLIPQVSFAFPTLFMVWFFVGFFAVATNEQAVKSLFGHPYAYAGNGLRWMLWLPFGLSQVIRYTRVPVELSFTETGNILTKKGRYESYEDEIDSIIVTARNLSLFFEWPEGADLLKSATKLGDPTDKAALTDLFQGAILDELRSVGSRRTWVDLWQNSTKFAEDVAANLVAENSRTTAANLVRDAGLQNPRIAIEHLDISPDVNTALNRIEVEKLIKKAAVIKAEGEKQAAIKKGEGEKRVEELFFEAVGTDPTRVILEGQRALVRTAQGQATTIFLPTDVVSLLGRVAGGEKRVSVSELLAALTPDQKAELIALLSREMRAQ